MTARKALAMRDSRLQEKYKNNSPRSDDDNMSTKLCVIHHDAQLQQEEVQSSSNGVGGVRTLRVSSLPQDIDEGLEGGEDADGSSLASPSSAAATCMNGSKARPRHMAAGDAAMKGGAVNARLALAARDP